MDDLRQSHHYTPKAYLKGWADSTGNVFTYRLLVPVGTYPLWERRSPSRIANRRHLYTSIASGTESDDFERWLNHEVEQPALSALRRIRSDETLSTEDWQRLAIYAVALDLRTPASYVEGYHRWNEQLPAMLNETMAEFEQKLRKKALRPLPGEAMQRQSANSAFHISVKTLENDGEVGIETTVTVGRELWLWQMRYIINRAREWVRTLRWHILRPHAGSQWFTSDHPVLRLNYYEKDRYDFGGGWGNPGTEIMLPLSPMHLMYTRVGETRAPDTPSIDQTLRLQRMIAERAHRWIIACGQPKRAEWFRPRVVDMDRFVEEEQGWRSWHDLQSQANPQG